MRQPAVPRINVSRSVFSSVALAAGLLLGGCTDNGVGRKCLIAPLPDGGITSATISSPALECVGRICLGEPPLPGTTNPPRTTCSTTCNSASDCSSGQGAVTGNAADGMCPSGFVCAVPLATGGFACKTMCMCADDLVCGFNKDPAGHIVTPPACGGTAIAGCP
jgi:hypothetical protein